MKSYPAVQAVHLTLEHIEHGVVRLLGGHYRAVLQVSSLNFSLAGDVEREAVLASYKAFLNSLTFPVQVLVRVLPVHLDVYVDDMESRAQEELPEALAEIARDHAIFVRRLARHRTLLERRFYVVVPAEGATPTARRRLRLARPARNLDHDAARRQLTFRCEEVARQLARCGLQARRLGDVELAQLYYTCWCAELARVQRLRRQLGEYTSLVARLDPRAEGRLS